MPKLPTENSPKVEIFVDDKAVMVPGDTNLLEALKAVGIETPHVCYHPYLPVSGNCRQCLVEQEGPRGRMLVIACYTPVITRICRCPVTAASAWWSKKARVAVCS